MGGTSALVFGSNVEEQLMPYKVTDGLSPSRDLYCFGWWVGPASRYVKHTDWRDALRLKPGTTGDSRFLNGDAPAGLTYSALKGAIDFEYMDAETVQGSGQIWDYSRVIGIPDLFYEYALQDVMPNQAHDSFFELLDSRIKAAFPNFDDYQFAWLNFVDMKRIVYSRDRYIDLMCKSRVSADFLISKGAVTSMDTTDAIANISSTVLRIDAWRDYVHNFIQQLQDDDLVSLVYLKQ